MNNKILFFIIAFVIIAVTATFAKDYLAIGKAPQLQFSNNQNSEDSSAPISIGDSYEVETIAEGLSVPWAVVFTDEDRILVTERPGTIREVRDGVVSQNALLSLPVVANGEAGLMGLTLDPDYENNKLLYACYTYQNGNTLANRIVQILDRGTSLEVQKTILENAPAARFHAGCELAIGPDDMLYVTFGDATEKSLAQDKNSLAGKILRMNLDGSVPTDNPIPNSLMWSLGHRNPQGITWDTRNDEMYSTEHGPSGNDGPLGGDEVNHIIKGENYGWPTVSHENSKPEFVSPMAVFTPAVAPGSIYFYDGTMYPEFENTLLFATLKGEGLYRAVVNPENPKEIESYEKLPLPDIGRIRDVTQGPDGYIYLTTSNTDGRGDARAGDDKIVKIHP